MENTTSRHLMFLAGGVIILLVLSCLLGLALKQEKMIKHSVHLSAERLFESIVLTRRWNACYGGVFVLKREGMQSNPYLEHPDITSATGLTYTMKNPALMTREISLLAEQSGHYQYHITSLRLINPHNQPDEWERASLQQFENGVPETLQIAKLDGQQVYRLMRPLMVEEGCMQCHAKQGYRVGEVRGGISVSFPYEEIAINLAGNRIKMTSLGIAIVGILCFLFYFVIWRLVGHLCVVSGELTQQKQNLEELNAVLDQKVSERTAALQESEQRFRSTFEQAPVGIGHLAMDGRLLRMNRRFCEIIGVPPSQRTSLKFQDISFETKRMAGVEEWDALLLGDKDAFSLERRYIRKDLSEVWINLTISLVRRDSGAPGYYICVVEDMSERRSLQEQLRQAQKMEAIGTFAGGIAHDFNNILTPILGYTEMLMEDSDPGEKCYASLQAVFCAATRAQELIRQILTFSRRADKEKQPLNIVPVIKEVIKLLRSFLPSTLTLSQVLTNEDCIVYATPSQIHQIMMNLCTNAYQAMEGGSGVLTIELQVLEMPAAETIGSLPSGKYAVLKVTDTGCGMDQQTMERMYEPYFTTKAKGEGTGFGLSMVHGLVEDLHGAIVAESQAGQGTSFTLFLPLLEQDSGQQCRQPLHVEEMQGGNEHILLVDDEPAIVAMETTMLSDLGYKVTSFYKSVEALAYFREHAQAFDLVVTDITMPEMSGIVLAREISVLSPQLPIILCTGFTSANTEEIFKLHNNVVTLLTKPILRDDLARAVRHAIDDGVPRDGARPGRHPQ
nr:DUF3365 domain-containing protein [uncultured Desulfobulbus sp.]